MSISQRAGPVASLFLITAILPELLSGNTPAPQMFRIETLVFLLLAYGLPVLVIREWAVRHRLSIGGIFFAGMAYGLINEGLFAKTVFLEAGLPIDVFDQYGFAFGVNLPWTFFMMVWHAVSSVVLPIMLTHLLFPDAAARPWLGSKLMITLAAAAAFLPSLFFLHNSVSGPEVELPMLIALWAVMAVFAVIAARFHAAVPLLPNSARWKPLGFGIASFAPIIGLLIVAHHRPPVAVWFGVFALTILLWGFLLHSRRWHRLPAFGWFALGWYAQLALSSLIAVHTRSPLTFACDLAALSLLGYLIRKRSRGTAT